MRREKQKGRKEEITCNMKECTQWMILEGTGMKSEREDEHKYVRTYVVGHAQECHVECA